MSDLTLFSPSNVPAFARNNEISDNTRALAGGSTNAGIKRISIKGGVFRLIAGGKEMAAIDERYLNIIVVKAAPKISRIFYAKSYDADNITGPDCWSNDGERPDPTAEHRQSDTCMTCPQNVAGSGQGNSRACRYQQRLAVVLENNPNGDVLQLTLPATSVFGKEDGDKRPLQAYVKFLAMQSNPVNVEQIVTEMRFDTKAEAPKLHFKATRWLTEDEYAIVKTQGDSIEAQRAVVMTVAQTDGVKTPAPKLALAGKPPVATAAPVAEASEEPEKRSTATKPSAVPAKKGKLADIVSDWDDE